MDREAWRAAIHGYLENIVGLLDKKESRACTSGLWSGRPPFFYAGGLCGLAPPCPLSVIACQGLPGVSTEVSTSPQARVWGPSPSAAHSWPPMTTAGAAWAPLPVTAPVEVPSTLGKPSPTTRVSPKQTQDTGGLVSSKGSPLSRVDSRPWCWSLQSTQSLPRLPPARSPVTWLRKLRGSSSLAASLAKPTAGPRPE